MPNPWPQLPSDWQNVSNETIEKYRELLLGAEIDLVKSSRTADASPPKTLVDDPSETKLQDNLATLLVGSVERARDGAKFVETAAAALGTVYTGILGFAFAAASKPLPARGLYAAIFLGLAIVGASFYLAFIQKIRPIGRVEYRISKPENLWRRTEYLAAWTGEVARARSWALRAGVVALAFGVAFMPVAFLPNQILLGAAVGSSAASTAPTIVPSWPPPPTGIAEPEVAAVLYKAQLDQFTSKKDDAATVAASNGTSTDQLSAALFVTGLIIVLLFAVWEVPRPRRTPRTQSGPPPAAGTPGSEGGGSGTPAPTEGA
jgi:hypothetical protein